MNRYKFTIAEHTPLEEDIALDPELLGNVFENLLAAYNPETKETARKSTGSFYTPREIVDYMVEQSLANYPENDWQKLKILDPASRRLNGENTDDEIDALVFHLYGLTEEEMLTVLLSQNTSEPDRRRIQAFYKDYEMR